MSPPVQRPRHLPQKRAVGLSCACFSWDEAASSQQPLGDAVEYWRRQQKGKMSFGGSGCLLLRNVKSQSWK